MPIDLGFEETLPKMLNSLPLEAVFTYVSMEVCVVFFPLLHLEYNIIRTNAWPIVILS